MNQIIKYRDGTVKDENEAQSRMLKFLYQNIAGRMLLKLLTRPFVSKIAACYMTSQFSTWSIDRFIKNNHIDMSLFEEKKYTSYNDFFTRKIKPSARRVEHSPHSLIAPCDSKLTCYTIDKDSTFFIKGSPYTVESLLCDKVLADEFSGGICLVFRLCVDDYHRYIYFDDGKKSDNNFIKGVLHTVNPIALKKYNFYKTNCREYTVMETVNFGKAVQVEIGAMMVGRIVNYHKEYTFLRGEEKGYFMFGGSTIVILLKKDKAVINDDIICNSAENTETIVKLGETIGEVYGN